MALAVGCSRNAGNDEKTIKFWHFWSEPNQKTVVAELVRQFEKQSGCKVEITELSWNDGKTKLMAAFNSGTAPDVLELGSDWVAQFSSKNALAELKKGEADIEKFIDISHGPCLWGGKQFAAPWVVDTRVLFYNKSALKQAGMPDTPPATYEEMAAMCDKINSDKMYGFGANGPDQHRLYKKIVPLFWSNGGDILDASGKPVINSPANSAALEMYLKLARVGYIETQKQLDAAFAAGKVAFIMSGSWLTDKIAKENPSLDYGVAPVPAMKQGPGLSFAGGEYLAVSAKSTKRDKAIALVKFLTDGKNAAALCEKVNEAGFPADRNYYNDSRITSKPNKSVFAAQLLNAKMTPVHPEWLEMESIIENAVEEALYARKGSMQALGDAQAEVLRLVSKK